MVRRLLIVALIACFAANDAAAAVQIDSHSKSALLTTNDLVVRVCPYGDGIVRVEAAPGKTLPQKTSFAVIAKPDSTGWTIVEQSDRLLLKSDRMTASLGKTDGLINFTGATGAPLLTQNALSFHPASDAPRDGLIVGSTFQRNSDDHFFGGGVVNTLRAPTATVAMSNANTQIRIPVIYCNRGYGLFWDNPSRGSLQLTPTTMSWESTAGDLADFYVFAGPTADRTIAEYRHLTGNAPMLPRWAFGFWFSKNKFESQQQILDAAAAFRSRDFPIDLIVQDYFYWKPSLTDGPAWDQWGSHTFVSSRYPDPKGMIHQLHEQDHLHFMTVIWPRFDLTTAHAKELAAAGAMFPRAGETGWEKGTAFYDAFSAAGRQIYGRQVMQSLLPLGVDAWWMDAAEPEIAQGIFATFSSAAGPVSRVMDAYPLLHTAGIYAAQRAATADKRVVLLPRSAWAGSQRNSAINWTGDIEQNWKTLAWQIEGLQNFSIAGLPFITTDVGGYSPTPESDRELFVRWFQWGAFCPIFRVHGVGRPFPWQYGTEAEAILKKFDLLRYRLLPYIYSQAAQVTLKQQTLLRPLVMDFRNDPQALQTWDEFCFGPSLLICPVYHSARQAAASPEQFADLQHKPGGLTVTQYAANGDGKPSRYELDNSLKLRHSPPVTQPKTARFRIEGTFTPHITGPLVLVPWGTGFDPSRTDITINGKPVPLAPAETSWQYPAFPFHAETGVPVQLSIETAAPVQALRILRNSDEPLQQNVYLPAGTDWYDFWTGQRITGGQHQQLTVPLDTMPIYVRAGSILPMGAEEQYAAEHAHDPLELRVYRGADGEFTLYDDEGDNYDYETGRYATIPLRWDEAHKQLTIGDRRGDFPGMIPRRQFHIVFVSPGHGVGENVTAQIDRNVTYDGRSIVVQAGTDAREN